jgi:uncharacterized coiled-coil protein SlyX
VAPSDPPEPRDLLAERLRRLEARVAEMGATLTHANDDLAKAVERLDSLVDLVGRLGRVIDVQGTALHGDETQLERKVGMVAERVEVLGDNLAEVLSHLDRIRQRLDRVLGEDRNGR